MCRRNPGNQGRLAGVGKTDQTGVGEQLELQPEPLLLARASRLMFRGRLVSGRREMLVSATAAAAAGDEEPLAGSREVVQKLTCCVVVYHCPHGHRQLDGVSLAARPVTALAVPAAFGLMFGVKTEMEERVVVVACDHDDVAATAAVAAAGSSTGHELLPTEGQAAVAAVARFDLDSDFVDKHGGGWWAVGKAGFGETSGSR